MSAGNSRVSSAHTVCTEHIRSTTCCYTNAIYIKTCRRRWTSCQNDPTRSQCDVEFFKTMMQNMLPVVPMKTKNYWSQYDMLYECEKCKRKYRHKSTYRRHITYECGKEPMFRCPFLDCTYKAYQKTHTDAHIKTKHKLMALEYKR